jgi:hypothetical protein
MSQSSIRLVKTPDVEKVMSSLRKRYNLLSEAEIIKLALSEVYNREVQDTLERKQKLRETFYRAIEEGGKAGDKLLAQRVLKLEDLTEQEIYDLFLNTHKH